MIQGFYFLKSPKTICIAGALAVGISTAIAQDSNILEQYIQMGIDHNLTIKAKEIDIQKAQQALQQAKAQSMPSFNFDANYTAALGGRKLDFPIGDLLNPVYGTLNQITQSNSFPEVENTSIQFLPNNFHETKISFAYPIYNTDLKFNRQIQTQLLESKTGLKAAQELSIRYDVTLAYLQYLQTLQAEKIWQNSRTVLMELRRFNESLVKNNVATRDVVATAEYELSKVESELYTNERQQNSSRAYVNFLLGRDLQGALLLDSSLLSQPVPAYNLEASILQAQAQRPEIQALESLAGVAASNASREEANLKLPDFYLGGSFGFQGFGYKFNRDQAYGLAQVGMTYNLYDGKSQKSKIQAARLDQDLAQNQIQQVKDQLALETTVAWNELESARFAFQNTQKNIEAAKAIFKIVNNKYRAGQSLLLEFLDAQNRLLSAQLQENLARNTVLLKEAALKKAIGQSKL